MKKNPWLSRRRFTDLSPERIDAALAALRLFKDRQSGRDQPQGSLRRGRWTPDHSEACSCCRPDNLPRSNDAFAVRDHCRSLRHCEHLFHVSHADVESVRSTLEKLGVKVRSGEALSCLLSHQEDLQDRRGLQRDKFGIPVYFKDFLSEFLYGQSFRRSDGTCIDPGLVFHTPKEGISGVQRRI